MNEATKRYRAVMNRVGAVLCLWAIMYNGAALVIDILARIFYYVMSYEVAQTVLSIISSVAYFASFSIAALLYHTLGGQKYDQPVRFSPKLPKSSLLIVFAGVACVISFSFINSIAVEAMGVSPMPEIFSYPTDYSKDSVLILQFISIALVPAVCEEILFRGVILSNLIPYGKASAIVISSVLFGLMHGNLYQFIYATVAGIIIGCVYVATDSIWCSILLHMINNTVSVLQFSVSDRFSPEYAMVIVAVVDCIILLVGILCAYRLVTKRDGSGGETVGNRIKELTFSGELSIRDTAKGFLIPSVVAFVVASWILAFAAI